MIPKIKAQCIGIFCITLLFLAACRTTAKTPTLQPTSTLAGSEASPEDILGIWQPAVPSEDAMFQQLNPDGTCQQAFSLDGLRNSPTVTCTYKLEGSKLELTEVTVIGVPTCPDKTGTYTARMLATDRMKLTSVQDNCAPRRNSTAGEYIRVP